MFLLSLMSPIMDVLLIINQSNCFLSGCVCVSVCSRVGDTRAFHLI